MTIQRIQKVKVGERVFEQLKKLILSGEWKQGDKIPSETELAGMFGVSRITVRQELQKLNAMGLIETRRGEGSFVRTTDEDVRKLREINETMIQRHEAGDLKGFAKKDSEFHFEIGKITRNPLLIKTNAILQEVLQTSMVELIERRGAERSIKYHTLVVEAIAAHEEERAVSLMLKHLE